MVRELSFRISAGCACLLERDFQRRSDAQREIRRLYGVRGKIVHGSKSFAHNSLLEDASKAGEFAVRALRALFVRRPDLLDSPDRTKALLLGQSRAEKVPSAIR
jgi:hypothetical protein